MRRSAAAVRSPTSRSSSPRATGSSARRETDERPTVSGRGSASLGPRGGRSRVHDARLPARARRALARRRPPFRRHPTVLLAADAARGRPGRARLRRRGRGGGLRGRRRRRARSSSSRSSGSATRASGSERSPPLPRGRVRGDGRHPSASLALPDVDRGGQRATSSAASATSKSRWSASPASTAASSCTRSGAAAQRRDLLVECELPEVDELERERSAARERASRRDGRSCTPTATTAIPPGANDNGSGFGTMMELAAALAERGAAALDRVPLSRRRRRGRRTGSRPTSRPGRRRGRSARSAPRSTSTCSASGAGSKLVELGLWPDTEPIPHTEWLMRWVEGLADELGYDVGRMTAPWGVAESGRFIEAGVPAIWFWKPDDFYYHSVARHRRQARRQLAEGGGGHHRHRALAARERRRAADGDLTRKEHGHGCRRGEPRPADPAPPGGRASASASRSAPTRSLATQHDNVQYIADVRRFFVYGWEPNSLAVDHDVRAPSNRSTAACTSRRDRTGRTRARG